MALRVPLEKSYPTLALFDVEELSVRLVDWALVSVMSLAALKSTLPALASAVVTGWPLALKPAASYAPDRCP